MKSNKFLVLALLTFLGSMQGWPGGGRKAPAAAVAAGAKMSDEAAAVAAGAKMSDEAAAVAAPAKMSDGAAAAAAAPITNVQAANVVRKIVQEEQYKGMVGALNQVTQSDEVNNAVNILAIVLFAYVYFYHREDVIAYVNKLLEGAYGVFFAKMLIEPAKYAAKCFYDDRTRNEAIRYALKHPFEVGAGIALTFLSIEGVKDIIKNRKEKCPGYQKTSTYRRAARIVNGLEILLARRGARGSAGGGASGDATGANT